MFINDTLTSSHERQAEKRKSGLFPGCFMGSVFKRTHIFSFETRTDTKAHVKVYTESFSPAQYRLYLVRELWRISQTIRLCFRRVTVIFLLSRGFQDLPHVFWDSFTCKFYLSAFGTLTHQSVIMDNNPYTVYFRHPSKQQTLPLA